LIAECSWIGCESKVKRYRAWCSVTAISWETTFGAQPHRVSRMSWHPKNFYFLKRHPSLYNWTPGVQSILSALFANFAQQLAKRNGWWAKKDHHLFLQQLLNFFNGLNGHPPNFVDFLEQLVKNLRTPDTPISNLWLGATGERQ